MYLMRIKVNQLSKLVFEQNPNLPIVITPIFQRLPNLIQIVLVLVGLSNMSKEKTSVGFASH